jgi:hypothetical protein
MEDRDTNVTTLGTAMHNPADMGLNPDYIVL